MEAQRAGYSQEVPFKWAESASCFRAANLSLLLAVEITLENSWPVGGWFWLAVVWGILFFCCLLALCTCC